MGRRRVAHIGCYPITMSRWLFGAEPDAVVGQLERDPDFAASTDWVGVDALSDRAGDVHLRGPARVISENAHLRHEGAHRGRDSVQRSARSVCRVLSRRRRSSSPANPPKRSNFRRSISTGCRRINFPMRSVALARCPSRSKTRSRTWRSSMPCFASTESGRWENLSSRA